MQRSFNRSSRSPRIECWLQAFIVLCTLLFSTRDAVSQTHQWSQRFGGTSSDQGWAVAVDASGNVMVTGSFLGTVDFGGGNLVSAGGGDIFVAKYGKVPTGIDPEAPIFTNVLRGNFPNPFNPTTTIHFTLENTSHVTLSIYDARGRRVTTLIDDVRGAGPHEIRWDGTDAAGASVSSGVYFYRMKAGKTSLSRRMVLLK